MNNSNAKVELAELYLQGVLIDKDEDLAISLLEEELEVNKNARLVLGNTIHRNTSCDKHGTYMFNKNKDISPKRKFQYNPE